MKVGFSVDVQLEFVVFSLDGEIQVFGGAFLFFCELEFQMNIYAINDIIYGVCIYFGVIVYDD